MHVLLLDIYARPQAPECLSKRMERKAARNPRQVAAQNVNGERGKHEDGAYPEAPVAMHASPVWARVGLANLVAISFVVVFAPGHLFSISALSRTVRASKPFAHGINTYDHRASAVAFFRCRGSHWNRRIGNCGGWARRLPA